jgi:hypothetical protein
MVSEEGRCTGENDNRFSANRQSPDRPLTCGVNSPAPDQPQRTSRAAIIAMVLIVVVLALVSLFGNIQRVRRNQLERTIVIPASPTPSATAR